MTFDFIEKRRGPEAEWFWFPFADNDDFNPTWWSHRSLYGESRYSLLEVRSDGLEVARIELDTEVTFDHYLGTPHLDGTALEIQLIEVAASQRRRGIGTKVLHALATRYPERRLVASSDEAEGFWASLGWTRFDRQKDAQLSHFLFMQAEPRA
ncbi:GNAT family N-acetyltransferase [Micromonospora sp. NPDC004551]|uniref:GNAT family N-acetyltransferase n=1 Tax=Micromonospora sp. NPDC004551 TaxID=3154284 RepID=UPI0033A3B3A4